MYIFKYDIKLDEDGIPYVHIDESVEDKPEDKFMAVQLTLYQFRQIYEKRRKHFTEEQDQQMYNAIAFLNSVAIEMGNIMKGLMDTSEEIKEEIKKTKDKPLPYDMVVDTIKERNNIPHQNIIYNDKILERKEKKLKVYVKETNKIYYLNGGITNKYWTELK